ncbi:unnamed protein product [Adineta ricciae]|uniref:G-protein coupled receptors family 1 profile domain-containing protein n=1 Tax=Adineta ricciae TaxID=249248 RepID=A0A814NEZ7_ADIRI|nr:unnamed protein product [Adineta ricciae]CAF1458787.1 unnamed protein product [Adineta ricciae]
MIHIANSCLATLICASDIYWISICTLRNDLQQIYNEYLLCVFGGYLTYVTCAVLNYSFLLQALYRYVIVIYPSNLFWQSQRCQILFVIVAWAYALIFPITFMFKGEIIYNMHNQICQIPLRLSFTMIFVTMSLYVSPLLLTILIYYRLVRYVYRMNKRIIPVNTLSRAQKELKMVRRTVTLLCTVFIIDFPYALFLFISFFTTPPRYHFRIAYVFINVGLACVIIILFQFTEQLRSSILKIFNLQLGTTTEPNNT